MPTFDEWGEDEDCGIYLASDNNGVRIIIESGDNSIRMDAEETRQLFQTLSKAYSEGK